MVARVAMSIDERRDADRQFKRIFAPVPPECTARASTARRRMASLCRCLRLQEYARWRLSGINSHGGCGAYTPCLFACLILTDVWS